MESSKILQDISTILTKFQPISKLRRIMIILFNSFADENGANDSEKASKEIKELQKQFDESYKELLHLQQKLSPSNLIIKVLPNNSDDLL
jgi:archaellum biogenesis protein FlaJ (TadC family)